MKTAILATVLLSVLILCSVIVIRTQDKQAELQVIEMIEENSRVLAKKERGFMAKQCARCREKLRTGEGLEVELDVLWDQIVSISSNDRARKVLIGLVEELETLDRERELRTMPQRFKRAKDAKFHASLFSGRL